jgi:uncharacterized protein YhaN
MPTEQELEKTLSESAKIFEQTATLERTIEQMFAQREEFARDFGVDFDTMTDKMNARNLNEEEKKKLAEERAAFDAEMEQDLRAAEEKFRREKMGTSAPAASRRRNMI